MIYDIITIGSASMDVLVKTAKDKVKHNSHVDLCYHLGDKILIDKLFFSTGGSGTNTAVAFSRLGLKTGFVGLIGTDPNGVTILEELKNEKVDFLGNIRKGNSGYSVILTQGKDRTILVHKGLNNDLLLSDIRLKSFNSSWVYISTMLGKSLETTKKLISIAKRNHSKIATNLSLYLAKFGLKKLEFLLKNSDILILNKDEAKALTKKESIQEMILAIAEYCTGIIVITNGSEKIHAYHWKKHYTKKVRPINSIDSTGAGDAFAAGFVYGIIKEKGLETALNYGCIEASATLKEYGAKNNLLKNLN